MPAALAGARPAGGGAGRRTARPGSSRAASTPTSGSTPWWAGRARTGAWTRPASTRCARAASTSTPGWRDMDMAGIWAVAVLPLPGGRVLRLGLLPGRATPSWAWPASGPGTAGTTRCGPAPIPSGSSRCSCPGWPTSRWPPTEVRRNAELGFRAVSFPEFPAQLGLPSIFTGHWDPFFAACEETGTVVCLHTGASAWAPLPSPDPPFELLPTLFPVNALMAAGEWLWSGVPAALPRPGRRPVRGGHRAGCPC